jgi:hypothetical protein
MMLFLTPSDGTPGDLVVKGSPMSVIVEIRAAEGGADARDLVREQFSVYAKRAARHCL